MTSTLPRPAAAEVPARRTAPLSRRFVAVSVAVWLVVTLGCLGLIIYGLGPLLQNREQRALLTEFRGQIDRAVGETESLYGPTPPSRPTESGAPIAIVEIPRTAVRQVVVEGVGSADTDGAPGHVPGTAGPGQPGNSAIVGRRLGYGAPFRGLGTLVPGDPVIVTTVQGQSVYEVTEMRSTPLNEDVDYGRTGNDRLTLVTTSSRLPLASGEAIVVSAQLKGRPFVPTPQNGRADEADGRTGDGGPAVAQLILAGIGFLAVGLGAVALYRRWRPVATYLITTPALVATCVLAAEAASALLPPWI